MLLIYTLCMRGGLGLWAVSCRFYWHRATQSVLRNRFLMCFPGYKDSNPIYVKYNKNSLKKFVQNNKRRVIAGISKMAGACWTW